MKKAVFLSIVGLTAAIGVTHAETFPQSGNPITLIVPSTAGGGTDTATRLLAPLMEKELGTSIVTVDKPGGSMQIGFNYVASSKPDGYTLAMLIMPPAQSIYYDTGRTSTFQRKSLVPIGLYYGAPFGIAVKATSPYKTLKDLVEGAKANPGKLNGATSGFMASGHLALVAFAAGTNSTLTAIHYQGGGPELTALMGGQVDLSFNAVDELLPQEKAGSIRILAVMSDKRDALVPDVPTIGEAGFPEVGPFASYIGLSAPAGTPPEIVARLTAAMKNAMDDPTLKQRMTDLGNQLTYLDPAEYSRFWDNADARFKPLIETAIKQRK